MKIKKIFHQNVNIDGTLPQGGAVITRGVIRMSKGESFEESGYWISSVLPRTKDGTVEGILVIFESKNEMNEFFTTHEMYVS